MAMSSYEPRSPRGRRWPRRLAWLSVLVTIAAALLIGGAGPAHRLGLVDLGAAFGLLRQGAYLALGAAALGLATLLAASLCRRLKPALTGGLVLIAVAAMMIVPWQLQQRARQVPAIHDITTDMRDPPAFVALAPARNAAPNAVAYPGEASARQQRQAYPDLRPIILDLPLAEAMDAAEETARDQGWEVIRVGDTTLEATATTRWFGFKDDVAIRLNEVEDGVRVDVRSASRIGRSDIGTNAARIRAYLEALGKSTE
ncbi:DUF1499 domain-containing protein [Modicisalibacter radicis]|uniref:DUF1499 domain-containing protein n=1 Tax=Halomonas sp. EAR18 TaxID=2518972 RepID=UPI001FCEB25E|nr:DUF1499 domain-containing protein [Halomonas sp. EAR18]